VALTLPQGWKLVDPQANLKVDSPFGRYLRTEKQEGRTVSIDETLMLYRNRVTPKAYEEFAQFTGDVDLLQTRDLFVTKQ
jgi:hypothetical protein